MANLFDHFRPGLFWDVDLKNLDADKHQAHVIGRVVERGTLNEWRATRAYYGDARLRTAVTELREMSPRDVAFCCVALGLKKENFRCCTKRPFPRAPWIY